MTASGSARKRSRLTMNRRDEQESARHRRHRASPQCGHWRHRRQASRLARTRGSNLSHLIQSHYIWCILHTTLARRFLARGSAQLSSFTPTIMSSYDRRDKEYRDRDRDGDSHKDRRRSYSPDASSSRRDDDRDRKRSRRDDKDDRHRHRDSDRERGRDKDKEREKK